MHVRVINGQPKEYELTPRVGKIVQWLLDRQQDIAQPDKVQVTFDCSGGSVCVEVKERQKIDEV
jgi:tRNA U54 and U55 pseudouridine synthase Pus10